MAGAGARSDVIPRDALSVIHARKSVRRFTGGAVGREQLDTLLRAGMAAPTAMNRQPWSFVVVEGRAALDSLAAAMPRSRLLGKAGAAIVVCAAAAEAAGGRAEFAVIDASLAAGNILLAAEALGLGAVWTACYPDSGLMAAARRALAIPDGVVPLAIIPVGRPTGDDQPKDKYRPEKIHWGKW
ncbi:nitroreductase family protein [bacterium]|nr:nitroreductase family protein [bacterium]